MSIETQVLQGLRLKGRVSAMDLAEIYGLDETALTAVLTAFADAGLTREANGRLSITKPGRAELERLIEAERASLDAAAIKTGYDDFTGFNDTFKQLVTDWQLIDGQTPNDHTDPSYDAQIVEHLKVLHAEFLPLVDRLAELAPRLAPYRRRFSSALAKVCDGDHSWIAKPIADSYHTVWFELHEDLIGIAGLSRLAEAAAGRAQ